MEDELPQIVPGEQTLSASTKRSITTRQKKMIAIAIAIVIPLAALFYFKSFFIAATVDGSPISRLRVIEELERQGGKTVLNALIADALVDAEAERKEIVVSAQELDKEIAKLETSVTETGGSFEDALAERGFTRESLRRNIATQMKIRKLLADVITVSDDEISQYIADNEIPIPEEGADEYREQIRTQLSDKKFSQEAEGLIESLKAQADITYYVNY